MFVILTGKIAGLVSVADPVRQSTPEMPVGMWIAVGYAIPVFGILIGLAF